MKNSYFCSSMWAFLIIAISEVSLYLWLAIVFTGQLRHALTTEFDQAQLIAETSKQIVQIGCAAFGLVCALLLLDGVCRNILKGLQVWMIRITTLPYIIIFSFSLVTQKCRFPEQENIFYIILLVMQILILILASRFSRTMLSYSSEDCIMKGGNGGKKVDKDVEKVSMLIKIEKV